jgi:hypothetical protein
MIVQRAALNSILQNNVADIRFVRRDPKPGFPPTRRMICTKSYELLSSTNGRLSLNYIPPKGPPQLNEVAENLIVVWDILMQSFRNISMNDVNLIEQWPADEEFWTYFNESIYPMSKEQKFTFMNS